MLWSKCAIDYSKLFFTILHKGVSLYLCNLNDIACQKKKVHMNFAIPVPFCAFKKDAVDGFQVLIYH